MTIATSPSTHSVASLAPSGAAFINFGERTNVKRHVVILGLVARTHGAANLACAMKARVCRTAVRDRIVCAR